MTRIYQHQLEEMFDCLLDDCYQSWKFGTIKYAPSDVLKSTDRICYDQEFAGWLDDQINDEQIYEWSDGTYHDEAEEPTLETGE